MAGNATFTDLVTSTLRDRRAGFADNLTNHIPLLQLMKRNVQTVDGGRTLVEPLMYASNSNSGFYSGSEALATASTSGLTAAEFDWKQYYVNIVSDGLENMQNSGRNALINLADFKIKQAQATMNNDISTGIFSDGTGTAGKQIGGLLHLIPADPSTGTVGGIDRSDNDNSFWRSQVFDASTDGSASSSTTIQTNLNIAWLECVRGNDAPNVIVLDGVLYGYFQGSLQAIQRISSDVSGGSGFESIRFHGTGGSAAVIYDVALSSKTGFLLNTDHIFFKAHSQRNFVVDEKKMSVNQDADVIPVFFMGNMTMNNGSLQSHLKE